MNVIDLATEREKRDGPDPEFTYLDPMTGIRWNQYTCDYRFEDKSYAVTIWAQSFEDAEARIEAMKQTLTLGGQIYSEIPA